jgi:flavin reductase (DIM6/NTAB) family NADH-FMN oxidoreductase RutF
VERTTPTATPRLVSLQVAAPLWSRFFTVAPLVLVGTKEGEHFDVAPKHMAMPLGWENFYGFVCSPRHATYRNALEHRCFTVSFPDQELLLETGLAASGRASDASKPALAAVPTYPARVVEGVLVAGCTLHLECELERVVDGFGDNALVVGRVVAASAREDVLRDAETDDTDLVSEVGILAYLHPGRVATVRESFAFPFPADFSV